MYREYLETKARVQGYKVYTKLSSPLLHVDNSNVRLSYLNNVNLCVMHQAVPQSQDLENKCKYCVGVYQNADNTHEAKLASSLSFFS